MREASAAMKGAAEKRGITIMLDGMKAIGRGTVIVALLLIAPGGQIASSVKVNVRSPSTESSTPPEPKTASEAENYARSLRKSFADEGFEVSVYYVDDEKTLMLLSDEFKDAAGREAVAAKLQGSRKRLCDIGIWYAEVGYSKGMLSGNVTKKISFGCPAARAARVLATQQERAKYAAGLNVDPSIRVRADGTVLVAESDEYFSQAKYRTAFLQKFLNDPDIKGNLCRLAFSQIQLKTRGRTVRTGTVPCR